AVFNTIMAMRQQRYAACHFRQPVSTIRRASVTNRDRRGWQPGLRAKSVYRVAMSAPALLPSCPRLKILRAIWGERNTTVIQTILMIEKIDHCRDVPAAHHLINLRQAACFEQRRDLRPFAHALWTEQHRPDGLIGREQRQRVQCFVTGGTAAGS